MSRRNLERYRAAKHQHASVEEFRGAKLKSGIHSIAYQDATIDLLVKRRSQARTVIFSFHGAVPAEGTSTPVLVGLGITQDVPAHTVLISDPSLELDDHLRLAWFAGNHRQPLQRDLVDLFAHVVKALRAEHVVFYGASGGGYAALHYSSHVPGSLAFATNPQTIVSEYDPVAVREYVDACWPGHEDEPVADVLARHVANDLGEIYAGRPGNTVAYLQNESDWHVAKHMEPFMARLPDDHDVHVRMGDFGQGHAAPPKELVSAVLHAAAEADGDWAGALATLEFEPSPRAARASRGLGGWWRRRAARARAAGRAATRG
jgi:hypothetical protein